MEAQLNVFSFGGGVQSTAALVLAARGELPISTFLFANVGDDSENGKTLAYVRDHSMPFAQAHGLQLLEIRRVRREGSPATLLQHLYRSERSIGIPIRMGGKADGAPGRRQCTVDWKIRVVARWLKQHGATAQNPATVNLGISMDEWQRAKSPDASGIEWTRLAYPLIDRRLRRDNCEQLIAGAGLPPVPRSACWFCPFHSTSAWQEMARKEPGSFRKTVELEEMLNRRREMLGLDPIFFSHRLRPLRIAIQDDGQLDLDIGAGCESGFCHT